MQNGNGSWLVKRDPVLPLCEVTLTQAFPPRVTPGRERTEWHRVAVVKVRQHFPPAAPDILAPAVMGYVVSYVDLRFHRSARRGNVLGDVVSYVNLLILRDTGTKGQSDRGKRRIGEPGKRSAERRNP